MNSRSKMRRMAAQNPDKLIEEVERLRKESIYEWFPDIAKGIDWPKELCALRLQNQSLRELLKKARRLIVPPQDHHANLVWQDAHLSTLKQIEDVLAKIK